MSRFAARADVHLWEEPVVEDVAQPRLGHALSTSGVHVVTPVLPHGLSDAEAVQAQRSLLDEYVGEHIEGDFIAWYYTPMALRFSAHLEPRVTVYDCMDELSAFEGAPPELVQLERFLFERADVMFAGGASLYEAKRLQHRNLHLFASSIDRDHFASARNGYIDPDDQRDIPHPRIGFYGVLDERLDRDLLRSVAVEHPEWHFVLLGPVVKIREEDLPRAANLHYLGGKDYAELPKYLANWDVAMLPFAQNAATRFISPTKTPEYLAAGRPVVSTPIRDVVRPYGEQGLVHIGGDPQSFAQGITKSLRAEDPEWSAAVDRFLAGNSWDNTFERMWKEIQRCMPPGAVRSATSTSGLQERNPCLTT